MQPSFIHLRLHTEFSLIDGIVKIKPLVKRLSELSMPAIAVTAHANLFSLVKFYKSAMGQGIKPKAGADVLIFNPEEPATPYRLTLLVNNHTGYITLTELISRAYQEGQHQGVPMLRQEWIEDNHRGLIALSGAVKQCFPDGCTYFRWKCRNLNQGISCPKKYRHVGRLCFSCRSFCDVKEINRPEMMSRMHSLNGSRANSKSLKTGLSNIRAGR